MRTSFLWVCLKTVSDGFIAIDGHFILHWVRINKRSSKEVPCFPKVASSYHIRSFPVQSPGIGSSLDPRMGNLGSSLVRSLGSATPVDSSIAVQLVSHEEKVLYEIEICIRSICYELK